MRRHNLAPRLEPGLWLALDRRRGRFSHLALRVLLVAQAHHFLALTLYLGGLGSGDSLQQALGTIEGAIGIVGREGLVVRPPVASVAQLVDERSLGLAQLSGEDLVPVERDRPEQHVRVRERVALAWAIRPEVRDLRPALAMNRFELAFHERLQPVA